jgi:DNA topoisomerase I
VTTSRRGGWRRLGRRRPFRYVDSRGARIDDEASIRRIESLVIPPAWRDVWISPNASARLQATGVDAAGRRQYLYHPRHREERDRAKFDRLVRFGELLPAFREQVAADLELGPYERAWTCAVAVTLVNRGWFRVGSDRAARTSRTYGITTLTKRHVSVRGRNVTFRFRAKHRVLVRTTLVDEELADAVRALTRFDRGARLLRFEREGAPVNLTAAALNAYIAQHLGGDFTAKDFRTWGGTLAAAVALAEHGPPATETDEKRVLAAVMRQVGAELGNTAAVARDAYVSPAVVEQWRDGRTLEHFRDRAARVVSGRNGGLQAEEAALVSLLRSWRIRRATAQESKSRR